MSGHQTKYSIDLTEHELRSLRKLFVQQSNLQRHKVLGPVFKRVDATLQAVLYRYIERVRYEVVP